MDTGNPPHLEPPERRAAADELARSAALRPRRDPQALGCLLAFAGMLVLTLTPAAGSWLEIPMGLGILIFSLAVAALFAGAAVALVGSRRARREGVDRAGVAREAVVAILAPEDGGRLDAVRGATRLVLLGQGGGSGSGPGTGTVADAHPVEVAKRLGPDGVGLVRSVERYLLETDPTLVPVFTRKDPGRAS